MRGEGVSIRRLRPDDLDSLFDHRSREFGVEWLRRQRQGEVHVAVAELDHTAVGRVGLDFMRFAGTGMVLLWAAHVEPEHQGRGIGTALFTHLEDVARERGFDAIQLAVEKSNERARRLYARLGYETVGEEMNRWSYRDEGRVVVVVEDCWTMRKTLGRPAD